MKIGKLFLFVLMFILMSGGLFGQRASTDRSGDDKGVSNAVDFYSRTVMNQSLLFNGNEYLEFPEPYDEFPYFASEYWEEGSVVYYDLAYEDVSMQYDLVKDELVIEHYGQDGYAVQVVLHKDKVDWFSLLGHTFINIRDESEAIGLRPGYYDQLIRGEDADLLCRRRKSLKEDVSAGVLEVSFTSRESYYLLREGKAYPVKTKKSIAKLFPEQKRQINQFSRERALNFKLQREQSLIDLVNYIETLGNKQQ